MKYWIRDIINFIYYYVFLISCKLNSGTRKFLKRNNIFIDWKGMFYFAIYIDNLDFINNPDIVKRRIIQDKETFFKFLSEKHIDELLYPEIKYINNTNTFLVRLKLIKLFQYHILTNLILILILLGLIIKFQIWKIF